MHNYFYFKILKKIDLPGDEGIILVIFIMKIVIYLTYVGHSLILTNDS